jgi:flagellar hook protein FlgE
MMVPDQDQETARMTLSSSLSAGIAGLQSNSTRLAVISDNIANSSTTGYRRGDVDFTSMVIPGNKTTYAAGGVRALAYREVSTPGAVVGTSNATDIAVNGRGFLPVTESGAIGLPAAERPFMVTPTGSFQRNEDGFLVTRSGLALTGWPTDGAGNIDPGVVRDGPASLEPIRVNPFLTTAQATSRIELGVNLPADDTAAGAPGDAYTSSIEYFDPIGRDHRINVTYTPTVPANGSSNEWTISFVDTATDPTVPVGDITVTFDDTTAGRGSIAAGGVTAGAGTTYDPATGLVTITTASGPLEIFIGPDSGGSALTQVDAPFAPLAVSADGSPAGTLTALEFDDGGFLRGIYDTGQEVTLYQVPLVDVPNPDGLRAFDNQAFGLSSESGDAFLWNANTGPVGGIEGFTLQESTVDIAEELTGLIQTQRAYSSNATVIQTVDEMLQETTNLKR